MKLIQANLIKLQNLWEINLININKTIAILLGLIVLFCTSVQAKVEIVTVNTQGRGLTVNDAVEDALINAVGQINGLSIAASTATAIAETSVDEKSNGKDVSDYTSASAYARSVEKNTKGIVKGWKKISEKSDGKLFLIELEVSIAKLSESEQTKRLRMAVLPLRINKGIKNQQQAIEFENTYGVNVTNYLTQTRRFAMLDRDFLYEQNLEQSFIKSDSVKTEELAKVGNRLGTDYLIVGVVDKVQGDVAVRKSKVSDKEVKSYSAKAEINLRIIDVATTQIKFSKNISLSSSGDLDSLAKKLAQNTGQFIVEAIYPMRIISVNDDKLTINQGGDTVKKGEKYNIYKLGKVLKDPYTSEKLGYEEDNVGTLVIDEIKPKISIGTLLEDRENIKVGTGLHKYIVRLVEKPVEKKENIKEQKIKIDKSINKIKEESEGDW